MTITELAPDARRNVALFTVGDSISIKPKFRFEKRKLADAQVETDILVVEDLPVFRSGTFRDSMGFQHTWEDIHMDQMVAHFDLLKNRGILADVPTRAGHPGFLANALHEVIGYHTALRTEKRTNQVDGEEYLYLLATFEVLDPGAIDKISRGLWRNVSSEVGSWVTNNETEFWPVYQGVAYVDFSAVEGLRQFNNHNGVGQKFSLLNAEKEAPVSGNDNTGTQTPPAPTQQPPAQPVAQLDPAAFARASFNFTIGGRQTNDFAAVQAHITNLETAASETRENNRKNFIKGLAEGQAPKILATQIDGIEAFALKLDDAGWEAFSKSWEVAAPTPVMQNHGVGQTGGNNDQPQGSTAEQAKSQEIADLEGIVKQHRMGKMAEDALKKTASYNKLKALKPDSTIL